MRPRCTLARMTLFGARLVTAFEFVLAAHEGHLRKGSDIPYVSHLLGVTSLVLESGGSETEAIAALLHDAVEDRDVALDEVESRFGSEIAGIVNEVSEERGAQELPWCDRKRAYVAHIDVASSSALRIAVADKLHNARSLLIDYRASGESLWARFDPEGDSLWYFRTLVHRLRLHVEDPRLGPQLDALERTVSALEAEVASAPHPLDDSYWLVPGRLLVGEYPYSADPVVGRRYLRRLAWSGIDLLLDLTEEGEHGLTPYASILERGEHRCGEHPPTRHVRYPIPDGGVPGREQMAATLDAIDRSLGSGRTVYVHCYGGVGRAGTVAGCYLVRHGTPPEQALDRIAELRRDTPDGRRDSPETPEQHRLVLTWREGD